MSKQRYSKIKSLFKTATNKDEKSVLNILSEESPETILSVPRYSREEMLAMGFDPDEFSEEELNEDISDKEIESIFEDLGFEDLGLSEERMEQRERPSAEEVRRLYEESKKRSE